MIYKTPLPNSAQRESKWVHNISCFFPFLQNSIIFQSLNVVQEDIIIAKTVPVTWLEIVEIIAFWRWVPFQEGPILYVKVMFEEESLLKWSWIEIE